MEAQSTPPPHLSYPDSASSSPRSRNNDAWDEPATATNKLRLMCSYGGHIVPRPHDKSLCYVGGDTRILTVDRATSLSDLSARLSKSFLKGQPFLLKYQLPNEDLDSLVSVTSDEDLENMVDEYSNRSPSRVRVFLFPPQPEAATGSTKSENWFLSALNRGLPDSASVNSLLGLDDDAAAAAPGQPKNSKQEVQSVPDSPMLGTNSSFGSSSSSPSVANLPPIRVRVEDSGGANRVPDQKGVGIEEQFAQLGVGGAGQKEDEGFAPLSSPPAAAANVSAVGATAAVSDDDRSEHGVPAGYRKPEPSQRQTQTKQTQVQLQSQGDVPQFQQKTTGFVDLHSPNSVSSDSSLLNATSFPKPVIYQDQVQIQSGTHNLSDQHGRIQMHQQHVHDPGFVLQQRQFDQQQQQQFDQQRQFDQQKQAQHQQQFDQQQLFDQQQQAQQQQFDQQRQFDQQKQAQQQQQFDQQQQAQQQQQFMHGTRVIQHTPAGPAYYPVYQQQQLHPQHHHLADQQYQVYYVPARPAQAYNLPAQHANVGESATSIPSSAAPSSAAYNPVRNAPLPQLVQIPSSQQHQQQQYVAYSQVHHPSQFMTPNSAAPSNYVYDSTDSAYAQMLYTQPPSQHNNRQ